MAIPGHIFDHVERGLEGLPTVLQKPRMRALLAVVLREVQALEDVLLALRVERWLESASGAQLDQYGRVVGEPRWGLTDGEYRGFLAARLLINRSNGEPERLSRVLGLMMGSGPVLVRAYFPAAVRFELLRQVPSAEAHRVRSSARLLEATAAGVEVLSVAEAVPGYLSWDGDTGAGAGWAGVWIEEVYRA